MLLTKDVFEWHLVDFTYGEWGLGKKGFEDGSTKATRIREEEAACALAGIRLHWLGGCDGSLYANEEMCEKLRRLVCEIDPRAIITHWPLSAALVPSALWYLVEDRAAPGRHAAEIGVDLVVAPPEAAHAGPEAAKVV